MRSTWILTTVLATAVLGVSGCSLLWTESYYAPKREIAINLRDTSVRPEVAEFRIKDWLWGPPLLPIIPFPQRCFDWWRRDQTFSINLRVSNPRTAVTLDLGKASLQTTGPPGRREPISIKPWCDAQQRGNKLRIPPSDSGCTVRLEFALPEHSVEQFDLVVGSMDANGEKAEFPKIPVKHYHHFGYGPIGMPLY